MAKKNNGSSSVKAAVAGACLTALSGLCFGIGLEAAKSIYHKAAWLVLKKRYEDVDILDDSEDYDEDFFFDDEDEDVDDDSSLFTKEDDIEIPCDSAVEDDGGDADEQQS